MTERNVRRCGGNLLDRQQFSKRAICEGPS
jgi:hypothetical protein